ncbi:regulatory protein YcgZ [Rahnella perminowiae]|uniref:regulatory protein YcgZ n=1 Tax=Rahnella perminowiae TaxID=2816244 RepID=UPI00215CDBEF|nr:regulatory protein YcgZ [Rahnella perminowiae]MCR9003586.1 regulatory protein YcgZ [Rahnella perminowiae]
MRQNRHNGTSPDTSHSLYTQVFFDEETMGRVVVEILEAGKNLNRKALCSKLLNRVEAAGSEEEEKHYMKLIRLVLERDS